MTTATGIEWEKIAADFYRSKCGRWDIWFSHYNRLWVSADWDVCKVKHDHDTLESAQAWCSERANTEDAA